MPAINFIRKFKIFAIEPWFFKIRKTCSFHIYCFAENGNEMYKDLKGTCTAFVLLIKPFVCRRSRCRRLGGLLKPLKIFDTRNGVIEFVNLEAVVKLSFSQILFQSNSCFVGILDLSYVTAIFFLILSGICPKWDKGVLKLNCPNKTNRNFYKLCIPQSPNAWYTVLGSKYSDQLISMFSVKRSLSSLKLKWFSWIHIFSVLSPYHANTCKKFSAISGRVTLATFSFKFSRNIAAWQVETHCSPHCLA